jgi:hypothetical protein
MHWGGFTAIGGVAAAVTAVVVTGEEVRRYPLPVSVARERLATAPLPEPLTAFAGQNVVVIREEGALLWHFGDAEHRSEGRVTLEGEGASTNVTVRFDLADNALGDSPMGATMMTKSMAENMFREHVDSLLGGRPFDMQKMGMALAQEMQANPEMLKEFGAALDQQFQEVATVMNETAAPQSVTIQSGDSRAATQPNPDSFRPMINP